MEELLNDEASIHSFIEFLVNEQSVENILFYLDVEAFKRLKRKQDIIIQANNIYNKYLITEAELEVTAIDAEERKKLTYILASKTGKVKNNFFDSAQKCVFNILKVSVPYRYAAAVAVRLTQHSVLWESSGSGLPKVSAERGAPRTRPGEWNEPTVPPELVNAAQPRLTVADGALSCSCVPRIPNAG